MSRLYHADAGSRQIVTATLARELAMRADVSFAFAYGSFVSGFDGFRDIDVAVWLAPGGDRFADASLATDLSRIVGFPVDVRIANAARVSFLSTCSVDGSSPCETNRSSPRSWNEPPVSITTRHRSCAWRRGMPSPRDARSRRHPWTLRGDRAGTAAARADP
jgi:hypothetical protein